MTDDRVQDEVDKDDYDRDRDDPVTQEKADHYIEMGGSHCIYCGSQSIYNTDRDYDGMMMYEYMHCSNCEHDWTETYLLIEIDLPDTNQHFEYDGQLGLDEVPYV
jgi:hypothetical protein